MLFSHFLFVFQNVDDFQKIRNSEKKKTIFQ